MQKKRKIFSLKNIFGVILSLIFISDIRYASSALFDGMVICIKRVIPSLFPLMVASELISTAGGKKNPAVFQLIMGWLFGFPICALGVSKLYSEGRISHNVYRTLICIGGLPSIGFFLGVCGDIFGIKYALALYLTSILSAILCGAFMHSRASGSRIPIYYTTKESETTLTVTEALSDSLRSGAYRCLSVTACVSFFYMISSCVTRFTGNAAVRAVLFGFFEFSGGCAACRTLPPKMGYIICSGILSFSGISAFMQTASAQRQYGITPDTKKYFAARLSQSIMSMLISVFIMSDNKGLALIPVIFVTVLLTIFCISQRINRKTLNRA